MNEERNCHDSIQKCGIFGVSRIAAQIGSASVIVHGPKGCVLPAYEATLTNPLSVSFTEMCRETTVFGGEDEVVYKIRMEYFTNNPKIIILVTSCASEIIGDDIKGAVFGLDLDVPIITVEGGSFINDHISGANLAMEKLAAELCDDAPEKTDIVNIIPPVEKYSGWKDDAKSIAVLLGEFGVKTRIIFCNTDVEEIKSYSSAALDLIIHREYGLKFAEFMEERFGIPYIMCDYPIGLEYTDKLVSDVLTALGKNTDETDAARQNLINNTRQRFREGLGRVTTFRYFEEIKKLKKVIVADAETALSVLNFLVNEFNDEVSTVIIKTNEVTPELKERSEKISPETEVIISEDRHEIIKHISEEKYDVIMGSDTEYLAASGRYDFAYINIDYPWARKIAFSKDGFACYDGLLYFTEVYYNKIVDRFNF